MSSASTKSIDTLLKNQKLLVVCGTGGVGKTTVSSALAIRAALLGRRAIVITIDPAKRLKTSLGIEELDDRELHLTEHLRKALSNIEPESKATNTLNGELHALMPDTRKTLEAFIWSLSPTEELAQKVFRNPIYEIFAKEFAGTNEYMALKRLHSLDQSPLYDLIILDTPPSRNTLDFLEAPTLLARFFDEKLIRWLVQPSQKFLGSRIGASLAYGLNIGMKKAMGLLEKLTGTGFITHLFDFASSLFQVQEAFTRTLQEVTELLRSERAAFLFVSAPTLDTGAEATHFIETIQAKGFRYGGHIVNRCLSHLSPNPASTLTLTTEQSQLLTALQNQEKEALQKVLQPPQQQLPELTRDIHCMEDLIYVARLFK